MYQKFPEAIVNNNKLVVNGLCIPNQPDLSGLMDIETSDSEPILASQVDPPTSPIISV